MNAKKKPLEIKAQKGGIIDWGNDSLGLRAKKGKKKVKA